MKKKFLLTFSAFALVFTSVFAAAGSGSKRDDLALMLPESDGVIVVDVKRLFDQALPQILSANEPMLSKVNTEVEKIRSKTGLDLRKFDRVAVGIKTVRLENGRFDFQPLLLARGNVDPKSVADAADLASGGNVRTETIGGRTVYIFSAKEIIDKNRSAGKSGGSLLEKMMDKVGGGMSEEAAMTLYDESTVAVGTPDRVRALIGDSPRIGAALIDLLSQKPNAMANFSFVLPEGMSTFFELEDDELGQGLDSVREMNGSLDVVPGKTVLSIAARTADQKQAENLETMLQGFQGVFSMILKKQKGADKQVYGRMLENLNVGRKADLVTIDLEIPQKDLDVIVGKK